MTDRDDDLTRRASRFAAAGLPAAIVRPDGSELPCEALNLSRSGLLLVGAPETEAGTRLRVAIRSASADLELRTTVEVKRCFTHEEDPALRRLGVEFGQLAAPDRETLEALVARVVEGAVPAAVASLAPDAKPHEVREALEKIPLVHRQAMAQRGSIRERELLMQDSSPRVVDALSRNPQLTAGEVRTLLRMPNLLPQTLETLARDGRWQASESMATAIASHRNTPFQVAERLASGMRPDQLRALVRAPGLNPGLRKKILAKLPKR